MSDRSNCCPFCNITIAPADSRRRVRNGQAAHAPCVQKHNLPGVVTEIRAFLDARNARFQSAWFDQKLRTSSSPDDVAALLGHVLGRLTAPSNGDGKDMTAIRAFADRMADRLYVAVEIRPPLLPRQAQS